MIHVGVFGSADDAEVSALAERLRHRGARASVIDLAAAPATMALAVGSGGTRVDGEPLDTLAAAYLRRLGRNPPPLAQLDDRYDGDRPAGTEVQGAEGLCRWKAGRQSTLAALQAERACLRLRAAAIEQLALERPVVNPPGLQNFHRLKPWLLAKLREAGVAVPSTAAGSCRGQLERFARAGGERWAGVVDKPLAGIYKTHLFTDPRGAEHRWGRRPLMLQRYIKGETVRCYVLAGELLSAARIVQGDTVDSSLSQTGIEVTELSSQERGMAEGAAQVLGLDFLGMDLQRDGASGESSLIDCNLSPMFVTYGRLSRCDVAGHLADHLIALARGPVSGPRPRALSLLDQAKELLATDSDIAELLGGRGGDSTPEGG